MDAANPNATTIAEYMNATANYRTDLYATCGTLLSHAESIELFKDLGVKMTPDSSPPAWKCRMKAITPKRTMPNR